MENKLIVGVIGLGMGNAHLKAAIACGAEIEAICDTNPSRLKTVGEEQNIPAEKQYTDWHDLLTNKKINAVIIASPDQLHREMCEAFVDAGVHIMCEKPLALCREDLDAIIAAANRSNKKFMVGQICRFTPAFVKAKEIIDAGTIGELYYVESEYAHDYQKMLSSVQKHWRSDPIRHGVVGGGCHAVDLLRWYAGDPEEVFAYGSHKLLPMVPYDDATVTILKFPNGICGKVFVSTGCKRPYTMRTQLWGTKGTILCDNTSDHMTLWTVDEDGVSLKSEPEIITIDINNHNAQKEFEVFADCVLKDKPVAMDALQGAMTVEVCLSIVKSSEVGTPIRPNYKF
ncbi:MAG: Gfo/Idh/MocA family oxidoreductase [Clostridia bacterium]|nr:Gfo/Idh/MocA family oxidoreductase [Clostridia bacterium]